MKIRRCRKPSDHPPARGSAVEPSLSPAADAPGVTALPHRPQPRRLDAADAPT